MFDTISVHRAYELGANAFMVKPLEPKDFLRVTSAGPDLLAPSSEKVNR